MLLTCMWICVVVYAFVVVYYLFWLFVVLSILYFGLFVVYLWICWLFVVYYWYCWLRIIGKFAFVGKYLFVAWPCVIDGADQLILVMIH
jgi:hypothetical protein